MKILTPMTTEEFEQAYKIKPFQGISNNATGGQSEQSSDATKAQPSPSFTSGSIKDYLQKPGYELGQTWMKSASTLVSPFTSVGKAVYDVTTGKKFTETINNVVEQNNKIIDDMSRNGIVNGTLEYERGMQQVKNNLKLISEISNDATQTRKDVGIAGLGNEDVSNLLSKGDYGRAFLTAATAGPAAFANSVYSPLSVPAKALIPGDGIASRVAQGVTTGAGLGGPAGAVAGGLFALIPSIENQAKKIPGLSEHLAKNPEDEKIFNDVLSLTMTVLGQGLSKKLAPDGKTDILNTPVSEVPGRIGQNLYDTTASAGTLVKPVVKKFADALEKENLRLTPKQKSDLNTKINDVVDYNEKNSITGNPQKRFDKIQENVDSKESTYQNFLEKGDGSKITIPKSKVLADLNTLKKQYENSDTLDLNSAVSKIDKAITKVESYGDDIPIANVNRLKRDAFDSAYSNSGNNKLLDPVHNEIGGVLKGNLEEATNGLKINGQSMAEFNREYGIALTSKQILKLAMGRNQLGLLGKITAKTVGGGVGGVTAGPVGAMLGGIFGDKVAQVLMGTNVRSHLSSLLGKISSDSEPSASSISGTTVSTIASNNANKNIISTNTTPKSQSTAVSSTQLPKAPKVGSFEQIQESGSGWKSGARIVFDTALRNGDKESILKLLPTVPASYKATFAQKIIDILSK